MISYQRKINLSMIYCFDVDGTICTITEDKDYSKALPIEGRIERINNLYDSGNTIIFHTARGFVTRKDWYEVTKRQLDEWNVKYHKLYMNKPNADLYIDDKGVEDKLFFDD